MQTTKNGWFWGRRQRNEETRDRTVNAADIVAEARAAGISLTPSGARLTVGYDRAPSPALMATLRTRKTEIIDYLEAEAFVLSAGGVIFDCEDGCSFTVDDVAFLTEADRHSITQRVA